jgi:L-iditol 2-dehydrogenase
MKEALMYGVGDVRVVDSPKPQVNKNEVLIAVRACGICPTDIRKYRTGDNGTLPLPMNLGHEFSGDVVEVGADVKNIKPGMRIMADGYVGYAEYAKIVDHFIPFIMELPDGVTYEEATFVEPLADCIYCVERRANVELDDKLVIIGGGTMGLMKLKVAKHRGVKVMMSDPLEHRREFALKFGADFAVKPEDLDLAVKDWTNGKGADAVILSAGVPGAVNQAMTVVKNRGHVVFFGGFKKGITAVIDPNLIHYKEIMVTGSYFVGVPPYSDRAMFVKSLSLIAQKVVPVAELITHRFPLGEIVKGLETAESLNGYKVMINIS